MKKALFLIILWLTLLQSYFSLNLSLNVYAQEKLEGKIAVLQLLNKSGLSTDEVIFLTTELQSIVQLETQGDYHVMTQENILTLLPPDKKLEDCAAAECEVDTGRMLGAALIVTGQMFKFGSDKDNLRLALRLHETKNGTLISTETIKGTSATDIEKQLKAAVQKLINQGLKGMKAKEFQDKLGTANQQEATGSTEDLAKKLEELNQLGQKEEKKEDGKLDYEAELKALEAENQKKEAHQKQVEQAWKQVLSVVNKGKIAISKQAVSLFLNQYNQHPLGNPKAKEAIELLENLNIQEENERKNALAQAHLSKVKISYEAVKPHLAKGDEQGQKALALFTDEFKNHPLGNPLLEEAEGFYQASKEKKEEADQAKHLKLVESDWSKAKKLVEKGDDKSKDALTLFLNKYESHPLGNPLANEAQSFYEERKALYDQKLKQEHQKALDAEWERLSKAMTAGGPTAVKTVELFLKKYASHPLGNPYQGEAENALADLKAGREVRAGGNSEISWILIKGGTFMMGSKEWEGDELPVHRVKVKNFYMSKTEVTVGQYRKCVEAGVCSEPDSCNWSSSVGERENHPINCVDWIQARAFAKWVGGDLPSEAQWEYAARSGGRGITYPWGNAKPTCELAAHYGGCGGGTTPVCSKTGGNTAQGLCDMGGNVWEWVLDEWHDSYSGAPSDDSGWCRDRGCSSNTSASRVNRGGSWYYVASFLRSARRYYISPGFRYDYLGFRVSRSVP